MAVNSNFTSFESLPLVLTVRETSRILGISLSKTYALVSSDAFPAIHLNRRILVPKAALEAWLQNPDG